MSAPIDFIRERADLAVIAGEYGVKLRKAGHDLVGCCPFHSEKSPSFTITPAKGLFRCFGCGVGGDVFRFLELAERVDFKGALKILAERTGVSLQNNQLSAEEKRAWAIQQADAEYIGHLAVIDRLSLADARSRWLAMDESKRTWVREDFEFCKGLTAVIVGMLAETQEQTAVEAA